MKRLKVAFVLPSLHGGGAERAAVTLLNALPRDRYDLTLYLFAREGQYLADVGTHVRTLVGAAAGRTARVLALRRTIASERFDVVVSFLSHFVGYAAVRAGAARTKFVISQQTPLSAFLDDADYHWKRPAHRALFTRVARFVYPKADLIVATSKGVAEDLVMNYGVSRARTIVVPNPVDVDQVEQRSAEPLPGDLGPDGNATIVTAGRLAEAKNFPLLIDALSVLNERMPFRAWILGQGDLEPDVRARIRTAGLDDRVRLLGFQANPWKFMAAADVFVLTSRYEGFGNVLIEAMASGLPVVATASFGTRDIVEHERTGLLLESHDPHRIAEALERVLRNQEERRRFAANARARAREFSTASIIKRFDAAIRAVLPQS